MSDIKNQDIKLISIEKKTMTNKDGSTWDRYDVSAEAPEKDQFPVRFSFSTTKLDGSPTKAFKDFQSIRPLTGDTLTIGYTEKPGSYVDKKDGTTKETVYKTIISMELTAGPGVNNTRAPF